MIILNLPSVMRLCKPLFHSINLNNQKYPQNRCCIVSLENCFSFMGQGIESDTLCAFKIVCGLYAIISPLYEIPMGSWEQTAQERSKWRGLINKGAALYEKKRICEAERKRRERKAKRNVPPSDSMTLTCSTCNRQFRARIGLVSHQRTHQHTSALFKK